MFAEPEERIGGGEIRKIPVIIHGKERIATVRMGLFGSDMGVIITGRYRGKLVVPRWDWVLIQALEEQKLFNVKRFNPKWLKFVMYESIYDVARYTIEVAAQYGLTFHDGEKGRLLRAQQALIELNMLALGLRKGNAGRPSSG